MMTDEQLQLKLNEGLILIKYSAQGLNRASERATEFLLLNALIADEEREAEEAKAKLTTLVAAIQSQVYSRSKTDKVTEKKLEAEADTEYSEAREALENCEAKIRWLKTYGKIFENAHITYRNFAKE